MMEVYHLEVKLGGGESEVSLEKLVNRAMAEGIRKLQYEGIFLDYELTPVLTAE